MIITSNHIKIFEKRISQNEPLRLFPAAFSNVHWLCYAVYFKQTFAELTYFTNLTAEGTVYKDYCARAGKSEDNRKLN